MGKGCERLERAAGNTGMVTETTKPGKSALQAQVGNSMACQDEQGRKETDYQVGRKQQSKRAKTVYQGLVFIFNFICMATMQCL